MSDSNQRSSDGRPSSSLATSRSLLGLARQGDADAWGRLSDLYAPLVFHWCRRRGLGDADASDVVQEVFQAVATHLAPFRKREAGGSFRGWLRTITENKIRDLFRGRAREARGVGGTEARHRLDQVPSPPGLESSASEETWDRGFLGRVLDLVRQEFEERTWAAFWRTAIDGRAPADVA